MRLAAVVSLGLLLVAAGCGDDGASNSDDVGTGSTSDDTFTTSSTATSSSSSTGEPTPEPFEYARGIRLERITANQGVEVEIVRDGVAVSADEFTMRMIQGRRTLLRGYWSLHAEFEARELIGRLTVDYPDGSQTEQDFVQMVAGTSNESPSATFQWLLEPDEVVPGMQIRARVIEPDPATAPGEVSEPPPIAPLAGPTELSVTADIMQLEVVLVPLLHQFDGQECSPQISEDERLVLQQKLEEHNPVQEALVTIREPLPYTESIADGPGFSPINAALAQAKIADEAAAHVYYYGLILPCDGFPPGLLGQAIDIPNAPMSTDEVPFASQGRISSGRWFGDILATADTFVHEVGHTQSRFHVTCSGGEAGPDNDYPHPGGRINAWGFGIYDFSLRGPAAYADYMSYCSSSWVSDYGWEQTYDVIRVLTEYASLADERPTDPTVLAGIVDGDFETWWLEPGPLPVATPSDSLELRGPSGPVEVPARVHRIPHSEHGLNIRAPLPVDAQSLSAGVLHRADGDRTLDLQR